MSEGRIEGISKRLPGFLGGGTVTMIDHLQWPNDGGGNATEFTITVSGNEDLLIFAWARTEDNEGHGVGIHIDHDREDEGLITNTASYNNGDSYGDLWTVGLWAYARNGTEEQRAVEIAINAEAITFPLTAGEHLISLTQGGVASWTGTGAITVFHVTPERSSNEHQGTT